MKFGARPSRLILFHLRSQGNVRSYPFRGQIRPERLTACASIWTGCIITSASGNRVEACDVILS